MTPIKAAEAAIAADRAYADRALWITRLPDAEILARARALEAEGPRGRPLWGRSFAVKDNIDVAGLPTTAGCPDFGYRPERDATAVRRLLEGGALLLGKTNLDQFATGLVGTRSPYGTPRNALAPGHVPGGSSSGSAVAVGAGIADFALGTDTAGSGRVPAAFGGIVGLKPTCGSVSAAGMVPACRSLDTISVLARGVDSALDVQRVIAGYDDADPYSRAAPFPHLRRGAAAPGMRVAMAAVGELCAAETARLYAEAGQMLTAEPVEIGIFLEIARLLYDGPWVAERSAALRPVLATRPGILHPVTRAVLETGLTRRTVDAFDAFHRLAEAKREAARLFGRFDALLLPTAPFCPSLAEVAADPIGVNSRLGSFTNFVNLCDLAALSVPAGTGADGLPVGVTVIGPAWSEGRLAGLADALAGRAAPADALAADETALFCIGAHMAGLPLNRQITALGGRFLREAATAPCYRLFALGQRPGLLRAERGVTIEGEIWAVPTNAIGALLAQVAPPLGFGTVALRDGPCLGFLAEASGVADTPEITGYGGWRAWLAAGLASAAGA